MRSYVKKGGKKPLHHSAKPLRAPYAPHCFFLSLLSIPPILDAVLAYSDPREIFRFARTCRDAREAVSRYMKRAFNFESFFRVFFRDPFDFRRLLARTGAVVSGLNGLHYLGRTGYFHDALDLYVNPNEAVLICQWLTSTGDGYVFLPSDNQQSTWKRALDMAPLHHESDEYTSLTSDLTHNLTFVNNDGSDKERRVRVKVCGKPSQPASVIKAILSFDHSCLMNVITHHAAYGLYGSLTFRQHISFVFEFQSGKEVAMKKYKVLNGDSISLEKYGDFPAGWDNPAFNIMRYVGDGHCWTAPHTPHREIPTTDLITMNEWKLTTDEGILRTHVHSLHVLGMKHGYTRHDGVPHSVVAKKTMVAVAQKLLLRAMDENREYQGDELDRETYAIWQQLKDLKFARSYWAQAEGNH